MPSWFDRILRALENGARVTAEGLRTERIRKANLPKYQVTDADRAEARRRHDAVIAARPYAEVVYVGGRHNTVEEYLEEQARIIARARSKAEKLRARRARARARKMAAKAVARAAKEA